MIILHHSTYDERSILEGLGAAEYSYWFVRKAFRPILERFGIVIPVIDPERDGATIQRSAAQHGTDCVLFSFNPPRYTPKDLACPVVPVFAWEYDRIPDESWNDNPQEDWRMPLKRTGIGITHSSDAARAVRNQMGEDYPVWVIPAPMFGRGAAHRATARGVQPAREIVLDGGIAIDTGAIDLGLFGCERPNGDGERALHMLRHMAEQADRGPQRLQLDGVVYTSVFNPGDGRKDWGDMIGGFVWAFRDRPDATLVLKLTMANIVDAMFAVLRHISRLGRFSCRIVLIHGLLSEEAYSALIDTTSFALNTSQGEGQCLPLMEFMSAGRPAVAPRHTSMLDYVDDTDSFVVSSHRRPGTWPHDERHAYRCLRHQIEFDSLVHQFQQSYTVAKTDPDLYARMSASAIEAQRNYCSEELVTARLAEVFAHLGVSSDVVPLRKSSRSSGKQGALA
ncbi:glycosyltransferase [Nostoc sp. 3335mG]|nr:glycosyltransferase [Nostoc sp. 3335mG]